jgi:hypothetical protein
LIQAHIKKKKRENCTTPPKGLMKEGWEKSKSDIRRLLGFASRVSSNRFRKKKKKGEENTLCVVPVHGASQKKKKKKKRGRRPL